ncbi:MAG TPA: bifunctional acetate--CoA ligase family protein/GNAT family N-acetyltransferase [Thermodesulfobacteriota bacterium]|nr:bifunctional acetate--CoA ligase family protein/GNAT family N-acetyltransferase [Thermodesulfobacteriota bacterium]
MIKGSLKRMLNPQTIALIGVTEKEDTPGRTLLENLCSWSKDLRKIFMVNPNRKTVLGYECYPEISAVPEHVDLSIIVTPAPTVPEIVEECGKVDTEGIIVISAGFREIGEEGRKLETQIKTIRDRYGMRIIGPNCLGVIRPHVALNASILKVLPKAGNTAFISQSGALGGAVFDWAMLAHAGFSIFASLGSMVDVDYGDLVDFLSSDANTRSIVFYMEEGIGNAKKFISAVKGFARYKPIIAVKPGRFLETPKPSLSHAGGMVLSDQVYDAAFRRMSIVRVKEIADLFNVVRVLQSKHLPRGLGLGIVTNAIGVGVMATDALIEMGGQLASISEEGFKNLSAVLPSYWNKTNPVDVFSDAEIERYLHVIQVLLQETEVDGILIIYTLQKTPQPKELATAITDLAKMSSKPIIAAWIGGKEAQEGREIFFENHIPTYETPEDAVKAYLCLYDYRRSLEFQYETPADLPVDQGPSKNNLKAFIRRVFREGRMVLNEEESNRFLATYGIPTVQSEISRDVGDAISIAKYIGYPVALKIMSPDIIYRMDVGGVVTGINSEDELRKEFEQLMERTKKYAPKARIVGISVQKMIEKIDYEIFLGAKKDKDFGSVIVLGIGGLGVQIFKEFSIGLPPLNQALARRLMEETEVYKMIQGYGRKPPADLRQLEQIIVSFSNLIVDFPEIAEMDINPLAISNGKASALSARIIIDKDSLDYASPYSHLVITPYPTRYVIPWMLPDGTEVLLRPVKPEDEPLVKEMLTSLSEKTLKERFFQVIKSITHEMLIKLCNIDYNREMTIVAEIMAEIRENSPRKIIGIIGLMIDSDFKSGEFGVIIHDHYQGKGIGYKLIDVLIGIAQEKGLEEFYGIVLAENRKMLRICQKLGFTAEPFEDDLCKITLALK